MNGRLEPEGTFWMTTVDGGMMSVLIWLRYQQKPSQKNLDKLYLQKKMNKDCSVGGMLIVNIDANCYDSGVATMILHPMLCSGIHMLRFVKGNMFFPQIWLKNSHL